MNGVEDQLKRSSTFALEGCTFKPRLPSQIDNYKAHNNPEEDILQRGGSNMWYVGPAAKEFSVRDNDFAGTLFFWGHTQGTLRLENNRFHGADVQSGWTQNGLKDHITMTGMKPDERYPVSTAVVEVVDAPPWLRSKCKHGNSVECVLSS